VPAYAAGREGSFFRRSFKQSDAESFFPVAFLLGEGFPRG